MLKFTEIFYYDEYLEECASTDFLIDSDNVNDICAAFERDYTEKRVVYIKLRNGEFWRRVDFDGHWDKEN